MPRQSALRSEVVSAPPRALYASARNYSLGRSERQGARTQSFTRDWEESIWDFYDTVPEFRFAVSWVGNLLSRATLTAYQDGEPTTDATAIEAMTNLFGGVEGQREMLRLLGVHFTAVGEGFIVGIPEGKNQQDQWMIAAATEVRQSGVDGAEITVSGDKLPDDALVIRLWKPHPRKAKQSDCPSRAVIPILAELVGLTEYVAAQIDSRLSGAGLLLLPSEMELPIRTQTGVEVDGGESVGLELNGPESFAQVLSDTMGASITDRRSASRRTPVVLQGPGEYLDKVKLIEFWSGLDDNAKGLREEAIHRLALGMDMPPESLTGTGDMNHWSSFQIEEAAIKAHTEPLLDVICSAITDGYLRPYLEAEKVPDWETFDIIADTSQLRMRPNRSREAIELYDRAELSGEAMLRENGFDESNDRMSPDERIQWFIQKVAAGQTTPEIVADALRLLKVPITEPVAEPAAEERPVRSLDEHPRREVPDTRDAAAGLDPLVSAAEVMVFRALERAGNRLKARFGAPTDIPAAKLYLAVPTLSRTEADELLSDAWSCVEQLGYGGGLERSLQEYTIGLLRLSKAHERAALARHLSLSFTAVSAA